MRVGFAALALLLAVLPATALDLGAEMPLAAHAMEDGAGRRWSVAETRGERGALVMFICVHCPWVQKWNGRIAELGRAARAVQIGVIAVNSNDVKRVPQDGPANMQKQARQHGFEFPYVIDRASTLARAFGAQRTPEVFLFDSAGRLVYRGTIDDNADDAAAVDEHFLRDAIAALAAGRAPQPAVTKAFGCTIKMYPAD